MLTTIKTLVKKTPLRRTKSVAPGVSLFGFRLFWDKTLPKARSFYALEYALKLRGKYILDVGSGGGEHAKAFAANGAHVDCIDFGTSIYALNSPKSSTALNVINTDFNDFVPDKKYDVVWASHVLEHQRNVGLFLDKLIECCSPDGEVIITLPDIHRELCGGHLTLWSPGLLAYNIVLSGVNLKDSILIRGTHEFSIAFKPNKIQEMPRLTFDYGDINLLQSFFPPGFYEGCDPWLFW